MKSGNKLLTSIFAAVGMGLLILDAKTALEGAQEGIELCLRTVIPSLFPFFVLSILLTGSLPSRNIPILRPLGKLCGIPKGAESLMLVGLLGGYPVGAQSITQAYRSGQLNPQDARRMLGFCNNAGPAFIFGMAGTLFHSVSTAWVLWGIHILSALLTGFLLPGKQNRSAVIKYNTTVTLPQALERSVKVMAHVCGWVILFRVMISIFQRWWMWLVPETAQITIIGLLELSNGCCDLINISGEGLRFLLCACFLGVGGVCVAMQTVSVTGELGTGYYFPGKALQGLISFLLAAALQSILFGKMSIHPASIAVVMLISLGFVLLLKNNSRNPAPAIV